MSFEASDPPGSLPVGVTDDLEKIEGVAGNFGVYNEDEEEATDG